MSAGIGAERRNKGQVAGGVKRRRTPFRMGVVLILSGCSGPVDLELRLRAALSPNPFDGVRTVRVVGRLRGRVQVLDTVRWDQGPRALEERLDLEVTRLWVEGLDDAGALKAVAKSPPLDLVSQTPDSIELDFARIGTLSVMTAPSVLPPRSGWRAASVASEGVLLLGGALSDGQTPSETFLVDA